ncbi:hypothetical protein P9112_003346 [Eukaryota sp. TZLM1-RC]
MSTDAPIIDDYLEAKYTPLPFFFVLWRSILVSLVVSTSVYFILGHYYADQTWTEFEQAGCVPDCYCEAINDEAFCRQPANGFSSLTFGLTAVYIVSMNVNGSMKKSKLGAIFVFASIVFLIGLGSSAYHCMLTLTAERIDGISMHFISTYIATFSVMKLLCVLFSPTGLKQFHTKFMTWYSLIAALVIVYNLEIIRWGRLTWTILIICLFISIASEILFSIAQQEWPSVHFVLALAFLGFSYVVWELDRHGVACDPHSWFQLHGIWHVGLAVSLISLHHHYAGVRDKAW